MRVAVPLVSGMFLTMAHNRNELWQDYREKGDEGSRTKLINSFAFLLESIAENVISEHSKKVPIENLFSAGVFAMSDCIKAYPNDCPTPFEDYCRDTIKKAPDLILKAFNYSNDTVAPVN